MAEAKVKRLPLEDKKYLFCNAWRLLAADMPCPLPEYNFDKCLGRKHRFDWAFVDEKNGIRLGIEVDGGTWQPGGGRHGRDSDRVKLNIAAELGWRVLRYSVQMLECDPAGCVEQVKRTLAIK